MCDPYDTYYSYDDPTTGKVETLSGREIVDLFYSVWKERMVKAGRNPDDYCILDCIDDWVCENYAWVSD